MSIRIKLALATSLLLLTVLGGSRAFLAYQEKKYFTRQWDARMLETLRGFSSVCRESYLANNDLTILNYIHNLMERPEIAFVKFLDPQGGVRIASNPAKMGHHLTSAEALRVLSAVDMMRQNYTHPEYGPVYEVAMPVLYNREKIGVCRVGFSKERVDAAVDKEVASSAKRWNVVIFWSLMLGLAGSLLLATTMTHSIRRLEKGVKIIGRGKFDYRIAIHRSDEIGRLALRFNEMADSLEKLDEMKNMFVSSVSHELRSPLTAIKSYVGVILKGQTGTVAPQTREYLNVVMQNAGRLNNFVNDLLDLAKFEAGMTKLSCVPVSVPHIMEEVVLLFGPLAAENKCRLDFQTPPDLPLVWADADRLRQVFTNLVSNALKFTPEGGRVSLSAVYTDGFVECAVSDTGVGIPPESLPDIFNKFTQAQGQRKVRKVSGTGIGLSIAKSIVEAHGGRIWVESRVEQGTAFRFTVPVVTGSSTKAAGGAGDGSLILVVDDDPNLARIAGDTLAHHGFNCETVGSAEDMLEQLKSDPLPALILLDVMLPGIDGLKALKRIRENKRLSRIPVVMISTLSGYNHVEESKILGAADYITKPFDPTLMVERVRMVLSGQAPFSLSL